jgi:hypothetical protein
MGCGLSVADDGWSVADAQGLDEGSPGREHQIGGDGSQVLEEALAGTNWLEIEIVDPVGKVTYRNSFVTDLAVTKDNVAELAACGRSRWKIENETFNTLKTKGYSLEHNFGHGKEHLAAVLATMNLIAFAMHTVANLVDDAWKAARAAVDEHRILVVAQRHAFKPAISVRHARLA